MVKRKDIDKLDGQLAALRAKGPSTWNNRRIVSKVNEIIRAENKLAAQDGKDR